MIIPRKFLPIVEKHKAEIPVRLGALASDLGLEVFKSTLRPGISGLIEPSQSAPSGYRIKINRHEPVERQRFTLAHEISHFLLHRFDIGDGLVDDTLYRSALSSRKEIEANKLASQLVMPLDAIKAAAAAVADLSVDQQVDILAKKFRVSQQAMRIRLGV